MAKRIHNVGAGISEHTKRPLDFNRSTAAEKIAFFESICAAQQRPWRHQAGIVAAVRAQHEETKESAPDIYQDLDAYNAYYRERETEAWYVKELSSLATIVETAIENGDHWHAVEEGMHIGELLSELRLKFGTDWEKRALAGRKVYDGASQGGRERAKSDKIADRQQPLVDCYLRKRKEQWQHGPAVRYAAEHAHKDSAQKPYSPKQAKRILDPLE